MAWPVTGRPIVALLCVIFLPNLSGGWLGIPDFLPIIGNLDEVTVTVVLLRSLRRLGWSGVAGLE